MKIFENIVGDARCHSAAAPTVQERRIASKPTEENVANAPRRSFLSLPRNVFTRFAIGVVVFAAIVSCNQKDKTAHPEYRAMTEAVYASGVIMPRGEYKLYSMADGVIAERMVNEGDLVKAGEPLFRIDNEEQAARLAAARDVYRTAQANYGETSPALAEALAALRSQESKYATDSAHYARVRELFAANAATQSDYDRAKLSAQVAQNELAAARQRYERTKRQLFIELQNAESQFKVSAKQNANTLIRSLSSGMAYEIYKQQGEAVRRNDALALIGSPDETYIKLSVDELDVRKIKLGQEIIVKIDVYQDQMFKARIEKIYPMLNRQDQSFRVDAAFTERLPDRFVGVTAEANIIINRKERALVIPKTYLLSGDSVLVKTAEGEARKVKIRKGMENYDVVEVLEGLTEQSLLASSR